MSLACAIAIAVKTMANAKSQMPNVLLFFIDGLGIGTRGPHNPLDGLTDAEPLESFKTKSRQYHSTESWLELTPASESTAARRALPVKLRS
jgi:hypothetical protein